MADYFDPTAEYIDSLGECEGCYFPEDEWRYDDAEAEAIELISEGTQMYLNINLSFGTKPDETYFADVKDKASIDCGDYSEERLNAVLAEVNRKIRRGWQYMAERQLDAESFRV